MNFIEQFQQLREQQPHPCILTVHSENSNYCPYNNNSRNCYLLVGHNMDEDCFYGYWVGFCQDCTDCAFAERSTLCYECVDIKGCYNCDFCQDCQNCTDCRDCFDCIGCTNCFGCVNLRRKEYCIFNKQFTKDEYSKELEKYSAKAFLEFKLEQPHVFAQNYNNDEFTGDHVFNSKNAFNCFDVNELEDCFHATNLFHSKDCCDANFCAWAELVYECHSGVQLYGSNFCNVCWYSQNLEYCEYVFNSHDCFGCVSRNHARYEILNEQYEEEEYHARVAEIKSEMRKQGIYGEHAPSIYDECLAIEH
jgi:hypothetical protein